MSKKDITNHEVIIFLIESYEKENRQRLKWIEKHRERLQEAATLKRESKHWFESDVIAYNMAAGMPTLTRDHVNAGYNRRKTPIRDVREIPGIAHLRHGHSIVNLNLGDPEVDVRLKRPDTDLSLDPIMRPVDPKFTRVLYKAKSDNGRVEYLKRRTKEQPEDKYYFPECESYKYGWRLKESGLRSRPQYGMCWHLTNTLRSRVGPQPDPPHYKLPR